MIGRTNCDWVVCDKDFLFLLLYEGLGKEFEGNLLKGDEEKDIKNKYTHKIEKRSGWEVSDECRNIEYTGNDGEGVSSEVDVKIG